MKPLYLYTDATTVSIKHSFIPTYKCCPCTYMVIMFSYIKLQMLNAEHTSVSTWLSCIPAYRCSFCTKMVLLDSYIQIEILILPLHLHYVVFLSFYIHMQPPNLTGPPVFLHAESLYLHCSPVFLHKDTDGESTLYLRGYIQMKPL